VLHAFRQVAWVDWAGVKANVVVLATDVEVVALADWALATAQRPAKMTVEKRILRGWMYVWCG